MTLPSPRTEYYASQDFKKTKTKVLGVMNEIIAALGDYPVIAQNNLLLEMSYFSAGILFLGLVFNILLIMFVMIAVLLIYSLLMITTETKTFDTGVMRLLGLSSSGFVSMILIQATCFVLPAITLAYICSFPSLYFIF